jgi:threonine aldolase
MTPNPETNMVYFDPAETGLSHDAFLAQLLARGVRMGQVRGSADIDAAIQAVRLIAEAPRGSMANPTPAAPARGY